MYRVEMMVDGRPVSKIKHAGKFYLPVENGQKFDINVYNDTNERVLAVVSVDGLSVMNGEPASHASQGYVVDARSWVNIDGYRISQNETRAFKVDTGNQSYAEKMGHGKKNKGVIGVVIIPEKEWLQLHPRPIKRSWTDEYPYDSCSFDSGPRMSCCSRGISAQSAGTKMGNIQSSPCHEIQFTRDESRKKVITLYYDTTESLRNKGVPVDSYVNMPNPFPEEKWCPEV